jgi:hypothetical protein
MSQSNKKILVSGCGISWSQQTLRTWVNVLQSLGVNMVDVGGPAISNQSIVNRAFEHLLEGHGITDVVLQLTGIGKLDVEINQDRITHLVNSDPIRNFTHQNIWPSSNSLHHKSKQFWYKWLYSPGLERQDLCYKLILLDNWCCTHNVNLIVVQGYNIEWLEQQKNLLTNIIVNINDNINQMYHQSTMYQYHNHNNNNTVPCIEFQIDLAEYFLSYLKIDQTKKISKLREFYLSKHH